MLVWHEGCNKNDSSRDSGGGAKGCPWCIVGTPCAAGAGSKATQACIVGFERMGLQPLALQENLQLVGLPQEELQEQEAPCTLPLSFLESQPPCVALEHWRPESLVRCERQGVGELQKEVQKRTRGVVARLIARGARGATQVTFATRTAAMELSYPWCIVGTPLAEETLFEAAGTAQRRRCEEYILGNTSKEA